MIRDYPTIETTPAGFPELRVCAGLQPGDLVLHRNAFGGPMGLLISRTQRRMLKDLGFRGRRTIRAAAAYTHASCYGNRWDCLEMTRPRARKIAWTRRVKPGDQLLVRRPALCAADGSLVPIHSGLGGRIAEVAARDCLLGTPYPFRELYVFYLWSWGVQKLGRKRSVLDVFDGPDADVCSARYWHWCMQARIGWALTPQERIPATHYPAELAVSDRFITVCRLRVVADAGDTTKTGD